MYWVKTEKGGLCNLALATDIRVAWHDDPVKRELRQVKAFFITGGETADYTVLFTGTPDECEAYVASHAARLLALIAAEEQTLRKAGVIP